LLKVLQNHPLRAICPASAPSLRSCTFTRLLYFRRIVLFSSVAWQSSFSLHVPRCAYHVRFRHVSTHCARSFRTPAAPRASVLPINTIRHHRCLSPWRTPRHDSQVLPCHTPVQFVSTRRGFGGGRTLCVVEIYTSACERAFGWGLRVGLVWGCCVKVLRPPYIPSAHPSSSPWLNQ
jgi:hypothetical protein